MTGDPRYDAFGWDYTSLNPLEERAVAWYRRHAAEVGGPVLELACGSGRLLVALAEAGHEVTGIDLSDTMLALARARRDELPRHVRGRIRLVRGDMAAFDLPEQVGLIVVADNSFRSLPTREGLLRCLRTSRRHLRPGGRMLVTERRFDPSLYVDGVREHDGSEPVPHPETGAPVRRRVRVELDLERMRIHGVFRYRIGLPDGSEEEVACPFESLVLRPSDYLELFAEAGFDAALRVGFEDREDDGRDPDLCFVLKPGLPEAEKVPER
jgi:SAM-dependent methyltransferase